VDEQLSQKNVQLQDTKSDVK